MFLEFCEKQGEVEEYWGYFIGWLFILSDHRVEVEDEDWDFKGFEDYREKEEKPDSPLLEPQSPHSCSTWELPLDGWGSSSYCQSTPPPTRYD